MSLQISERSPVFDYTENNYFRWGYQRDVPFSNLPEKPEDVNLWFDIDPVTPSQFVQPPRTVRETSITAARRVLDAHAKLGRPMTLLISGGIDSEAMMYAFKLASGKQPDYTATIIRYAYGLNHHETALATKLCMNTRIPFEYIDVDPFPIYYSTPSWLIPFKLESGTLAVIMTVLDRLADKFSVMGVNPGLAGKPWDDVRLLMGLNRASTYAEEFWRSRDIPSVASFHMYTPSQLLAWIDHPLVRAWDRQLHGSGVTKYNQLKALIYQMEFPEITEDRPKWTGAELLRNHIKDIWDNQWSANRPFNPLTRRPVADVICELHGVVR